MIFRQVFQHVMAIEAAIAGFVFVLVLGALVVAVVRRRAGSGRAPSPRSKRPKLEWAYVGLLAVAAGFLMYLSLSSNARETPADSPPALAADKAAPAPTVSVDGFQWCWRFRYTQAPVTITGDCEAHRYPVMVVPTGRPIRLALESQDVVHSFWIPALDVKMDLYPDHTNYLTLSFDKPGEWLGRCAEYCGTYHSTMDFYVKAVPPAEYTKWLAQHGSAS